MDRPFRFHFVGNCKQCIHTHTHTHTHIYFWFAVLISVSLSVHEEIIGLVAGLNEIVLLKTLYSARYRVNVQ